MLNLAQGPNLTVGKLDWLCLVPGMPACSSLFPAGLVEVGFDES